MATYEKFTVTGHTGIPSGFYATYNDDGCMVMTRDHGYKVGDVVEVWGHDGYAAERIDVNGKTIWTEEDRRKWWTIYDQKSHMYPNPYRIDLVYSVKMARGHFESDPNKPAYAVDFDRGERLCHSVEEVEEYLTKKN